jgi:hypothetical protein
VGDTPSEESPFTVPEDLKSPAPGNDVAFEGAAVDAGAPARSGTSLPPVSSAPNATSAPRNRETSAARQRETSAARQRETSGAAPRETSAARQRETSAASARQVSAPRPRAEDDAFAEPAPKSGGGLGKILAVLVVLGLLGVAGLGGAFYFLSQGDTTETPPPVADAGAPKTTGASTSNLKAGTTELDWSPNAAGKGGVILQVPDGASEVLVTGLGAREAWDGSHNLRLKDIEPGSLRGKVKPRDGGPSVLADFSVEAGKTCIYAFKGGKWEKSECQ